MAKISTYTTVTPSSTDKVIGTEVVGTPIDSPVNFTIQDILKVLPSVQLTLPNYADDTAAGAAGLVTGQLYQTSGTVKVKQ